MLALTGCASHGDKKPKTQATTTVTQAPQVNPNTPVDGQKVIAYTCGANGATKLAVLYGFNGEDIVRAQVQLQDKISPVLLRNLNDTAHNSFVSNEGITWVTPLATRTSVDQTAGTALVQPAQQTVNGKTVIVPQVVTQNCQPDAQATAALQRRQGTAGVAPVRHVITKEPKVIKKTTTVKTTKKVVRAKK